MANSEYSPESLEVFKGWEINITSATRLRRNFPPKILTLKGNWSDSHLEMSCAKCDEKLEAHFGDFSQHLAEKLVKCPSGVKGHGYWASAINMCIN